MKGRRLRRWSADTGISPIRLGRWRRYKGPGVVGYQPRLEKDQSFQYTSFCPLRTEFGIMKGTYKMVNDEGEMFDAEIPPFRLMTPHAVN